MAQDFFCHAPEEKTFNSAAAMSRHGDQINLFLGRMVQYLLGIIPVANMSIDVQSPGSEAILQIFEVFLRLPDDLYLGLHGVHTWKSGSRNNPQ